MMVKRLLDLSLRFSQSKIRDSGRTLSNGQGSPTYAVICKENN